MDQLQHASNLHGYWAMTADERERHDALLLSKERLQRLPENERKTYLDTLYIHTLLGSELTLAILNDPEYGELLAQLQSAYDSLSRRQERLLELLAQY